MSTRQHSAMQWEGLAVGDRVRCRDPDDFIASLARKLRNREGIIERFQMFSGAPIIHFAAVGRRKEHKWVPPCRADIEIIETRCKHCGEQLPGCDCDMREEA